MMDGAWGTGWTAMGEALLTTGLRGLILLAFVSVAALLMCRTSAAGRHLLWCLGMVGLLVLPGVQAVAPSWSVPLTGPVADLFAPHAVAPAAASGSVGGMVTAPTDPGTVVSSGPASAESGARPFVASSPDGPRVAPSGDDPLGSARPASDPARARESGPPARRPASGFSDGAAWWMALVGAWAMGALAVLTSLVLSFRAVRRLERAARPLPGAGVSHEVAHLAMATGMRGPIRLLEGPRDQMPMSWGLLRPTILLPAGADGWPAERLRAVLRHELAHVQRRDCLTQLVAEVACAVHWFNPLAWVGVWRLRVEREHACDDRVIGAGGRATDYADELLALARSTRRGRSESLAAVALARPSGLEARLRAVLAEGRRRSLSGVGAGVTVAVVLVATTAAAGLAAPPAGSVGGPSTVGTEGLDVPGASFHNVGALPPGPRAPGGSTSADPPPLLPAPEAPTTSCGTEDAEWHSSSHRRNDDRTQIMWSRTGCEVEIVVEGEVEFAGTFDDVARLERGARLRIEEMDGATERFLEITPGSGGAPEYEYRVDRERRPFDAEARAWFEGMLLQLFRRAGFMAEERVSAFLARGGVPAVLQEMEHLRSDHVYALYVRETIRQADLSRGQIEGLLEQAAARVDSDHYMAEILGTVAASTDLSGAMLDTFVSASRTLDSDHYRAQVLAIALDRGELSDDQVRALLESAAEIESDHYQAQILEDVADRYALRPGLRDAYLAAVERIESDHYRTSVLQRLLQRPDLSDAEKATVLRAAGRIESDHYVTEVLTGLVARGLGTAALRDAFFDVTASVESDHYKREILVRLVTVEGDLDENQLRRVVEVARGIGSDHYKSEVLVEIARRHRLGGSAREAYVGAMESIGSSHYRGPVAEALLKNGG